uniref:Uncharacterized protein n=1 Tax=Rhizophagus irregularis (strain DAOM 181602 / DAOM 197198 / MUCL 43194) TaxID=747089 RepID=U9TQQ9_RHIID
MSCITIVTERHSIFTLAIELKGQEMEKLSVFLRVDQKINIYLTSLETFIKLLRRVTNLVLECRRILSLSDVQDLKSTLWEIMKLRICQLRNIIIIHSQNFHTKVLVWVIPHCIANISCMKYKKATDQEFKNSEIATRKSVLLKKGLNVSNDIFVEGPEYLEIQYQSDNQDETSNMMTVKILLNYTLLPKFAGNVNNFELGEYDLSGDEYKERLIEADIVNISRKMFSCGMGELIYGTGALARKADGIFLIMMIAIMNLYF